MSDELTPKQENFIDGVEMGLLPSQAAKRAGYSQPSQAAQQLMKKPAVAARLRAIEESRRQSMKMTREKAEAGIMEAIEMAKTNSDPQSMIRGWAEINRMCGFYAPEQKELKISGNAKRIRKEIESLDDSKLLELAGGGVIDGEFEEVEE